MTIKSRLKKLETKSGPDNFAMSPRFIAFESKEAELAIVPGHSGELRKADGESQGEFCQRAYLAYVDAKGLSSFRAEDLNDEDLQCIMASGSPDLALKLYRGEELSDLDIQCAISKID